MSEETMRTPWRQDESGNVLDASGKKVVLTGVALTCGYIADGDPCRVAMTEMIRAVNAYEPMRAALLAFRDSVYFPPPSRSDGSRAGAWFNAPGHNGARTADQLFVLLADALRAAGVEPKPEVRAQK